MERKTPLDITKEVPAWTRWVLVLSLSLFFFALPHTLEDFALGEPAKNGVPAYVLAFLVAGLFSLQGLALYWLGREKRSTYFMHAGLGLAWALAAGIEQLPAILASDSYRAGWISILYVTGMILIGLLLFGASLQALRSTGARAVGKNEHAR